MSKEKTIDSVSESVKGALEGTTASRRNTRSQLAIINTRLRQLIDAADAADNDKLGSQTLRNLLLDDCPESAGNSWLEAICNTMMKRALDGDVKAAAFVFERAFGKPSTNQIGDQVQKIALVVKQLDNATSQVLGVSSAASVAAPWLNPGGGHTVSTPTHTDRSPGLSEPRSSHTHAVPQISSAPSENSPTPSGSDIIDAEVIGESHAS